MGLFRKYYGFDASNSQVQCILNPGEVIIGGKLFGKRIPLSSITSSNGMSCSYRTIGSMYTIRFCANRESHTLYIRGFDTVTGESIDGERIYKYIVDNSGMSKAEKDKARKNITSDIHKHASAIAGVARASATSTQKQKDASVVGRAVAGGVIAGPAGAVVGALSAVDKNNKNKK